MTCSDLPFENITLDRTGEWATGREGIDGKDKLGYGTVGERYSHMR